MADTTIPIASTLDCRMFAAHIMNLQLTVSVCQDLVKGEGINRQGGDVVIISHDNPIDYCVLDIQRRGDVIKVGGHLVPEFRSGGRVPGNLICYYRLFLFILGFCYGQLAIQSAIYKVN